MAASARRGQALTLEEICIAALRLIEVGGVEGLSMRKLAAELDVNPMSLYHHVENKTELLKQICRLTAGTLELPPDDGTPWPDQLRALAHAYRALAHAGPSLWLYVEQHPDVLPEEDGLWEVFDRNLAAVGIPDEQRPHVRKALYAFCTGFISAELVGALDRPDGVTDIDRTFEVAIDLIIAGLERLSAQQP
jgi:AcrR family transcriptional regulator